MEMYLKNLAGALKVSAADIDIQDPVILCIIFIYFMRNFYPSKLHKPEAGRSTLL
jgi:hypothetical protein